MTDSIVMGKKWMAGMKVFVRAEKHPDTDVTIWRNCFGADIIRDRLRKGRCECCDATISEDQIKQQEIWDHRTQKTYHVCEVCAIMHRALYINHGLRNMNYFKNIDEAEMNKR